MGPFVVSMKQTCVRTDHRWMYEYMGEIIRVVDGDTVDVLMDLGFDLQFAIRLRLNGINAPERHTDEGKRATAWLSTLLRPGDCVIVRTFKDRREKYGRYLATIQAAPENWEGNLPIDVATELMRAGHAQPYVARTR